VAKRGSKEAVARHALDAAVTATPDRRVTLHVVEGALDGGLVRVSDLAADFAAGDPEEHADALGRAEGQVEARGAGAAALRGERGAGGWI
jgi:hypothetical protein